METSDNNIQMRTTVSDEEACYDLYNNYALDKGFSIRRGTIRYALYHIVSTNRQFLSQAFAEMRPMPQYHRPWMTYSHSSVVDTSSTQVPFEAHQLVPMCMPRVYYPYVPFEEQNRAHVQESNMTTFTSVQGHLEFNFEQVHGEGYGCQRPNVECDVPGVQCPRPYKKRSYMSMELVEVCPTEDALQTFLDYLVNPILPTKSREAPSLSLQQSVAKQVHAVVILYNYFHRKQHPHLEFLNFEQFCKLAAILKPTLLPHMNIMLNSGDAELKDLEKNISVTEKAVMVACDICKALDVSRVVPNTQGWPITTLAVLLVDHRSENCLLLFSSITLGVWSVIEKDLAQQRSESTIEIKMYKKRVSKKTTTDQNSDEQLENLALTAIKEATGIARTDLMILESHVVYSLNKEKTASKFFTIRCKKSVADEVMQVPIIDVVSSLQGPMVKKSSSSWTHTPAVEYFHVLPYARAISDWFFRNVSTENTQNLEMESGMVCENNSRFKPSCDKEMPVEKCELNGGSDEAIAFNALDEGATISLTEGGGDEQGPNVYPDEAPSIDNEATITPGEVMEETHGQNGLSEVESLDNGSQITIQKVNSDELRPNVNSSEAAALDNIETIIGNKSSDENGNTGSFLNEFSKNSSARGVDIDGSHMVFPGSDKNLEDISNYTLVRLQENVTPCKQTDHNALGNNAKVKVEVTDFMDTTKSESERVPTGNKSCKLSPIALVEISKDRALVNCVSDAKRLPPHPIVAKENELSQTSLKVLLRKRDKLAQQQRCIEDEIAQCEKNIQTILNGGEDDLALKIDSIIECCNDICLRSADYAQQHIYPQFKGEGSSHSIKRKRLSEATLNMQNPCQELDGICYENNWNLPTYRVSTFSTGFQAEVTVKGVDFTCSTGSGLCSNPRMGRESAAQQMLIKLRAMSAHSQ